MHLGKRLDESMIYSERTYELDAPGDSQRYEGCYPAAAQCRATAAARGTDPAGERPPRRCQPGPRNAAKGVAKARSRLRCRGLQLSGYGEHACREQHVAAIECHLLGGGQNRGRRAQAGDQQARWTSPQSSMSSIGRGGTAPPYRWLHAPFWYRMGRSVPSTQSERPVGVRRNSNRCTHRTGNSRDCTRFLG